MTRDPFIVAINGMTTETAESTEQMSVMLSYAEQAFWLLARLHGDRDHEGHHGFEAICTLCARALCSVAEKEGLAVEQLVADLRNAVKGGPPK